MEKGGLSMWPVRKKEREPFSAQDGMEEWKRREKTAAFCGGGEGIPFLPFPPRSVTHLGGEGGWGMKKKLADT